MEEKRLQESSSHITPDLVTEQLDHILAHPDFADCMRSQQFLRYVVRKTLEGHAGRIKGATIAQEVFQLEDPERVQTSTVVRVEAGRLRRRLELYYATDGQEDPLRITIPKGSYVPNFDLAAEQGSTPPLPPTPPPTQAMSRFYQPRGSAAYLWVIGLLLVVAALLWGFLSDSGPAREPATAIELWDKPSIAVLPFEDSAIEPGDLHLAAGLTEDIITDLSRLAGIDVIALPSVLPYRERKASPQLIRAELGVSHVLYGSVRGTREKLRVTAQLYQTKDGKQVWGERFDRELADILALQDELATKIVASTATGFDSTDHVRLGVRPDGNTEAQVLYKQALNLVNPPNDPGRIRAARRAFERVMEMAPDYAGGYAGAAYTHAFAAFWGRSKTPNQEIRLARELSEKALQLDDSFGLALSTQALVYMTQRNYKKALVASDQALQVQPNDPYVAIYHAAVLLSSGQAREGIKFARRALRLDPLSPRTPYLNILGMAHYHAGDYQEALAALQRNIDRGGPFGAHIQVYVTAVNAQLGNTSTAKEQLEVLNMYKDDFSWEDWLQRWHRDAKEAARVLEPIRSLSAGM